MILNQCWLPAKVHLYAVVNRLKSVARVDVCMDDFESVLATCQGTSICCCE